MSSSKRSQHGRKTTTKSSNLPRFTIANNERVHNLLTMITKANTTSVLHKLEDHRKKLSIPAFRVLLISIIKKLNSNTSSNFMYKQKRQVVKRKISKSNSRWQMFSKVDVVHCTRIIFYYIVSVINKYKIPSTENLWREILRNSLTQNRQFYEYLYKNKVIIPTATCKLFSQELPRFYSSKTCADKVKLVGIGFPFDKMITFATPIKHLEKMFFELKQKQCNSKITEPENVITFMNTPEKLSLFLSYFPDYDINQVNNVFKFTVLEQLIYMTPFFYKTEINTNYQIGPSVSVSRRFRYKAFSHLETSQLHSHPNEIVKYRAARIVNLLQQLISRGARLSEPVYSDISSWVTREHQFLATSLGIYVLIGLQMNDLYPCELSSQRDHSFVSFIIKYIRRFQTEFQHFILHRLTLSYSIVHKPEFIISQRENEDEQMQKINDRLFQQSLKLKEWCRLKIKDSCSQKVINQLNLSKSLVNYCSFDFFDANYALKCVKEVARYKGDITPKRIEYSHTTDQSIGFEIVEDDEQMIHNDYNDNS